MKLKQFIAGLISGAMMVGCVGMMPEQPEVAQNITAQAADYVPRTTAPTSDNANYFSGNIFYTSGYGMPNCTCYAWGRAKELLGYNPPLCTRNAQYWYGYNDGFARGSEPKLGAIACWDHSGGGHVAVVEAIDGDTVWLSESSWGGDFFNYTSKNKNNMGNCGFSGGYFQGYIYIGDWTTEPQNLGDNFTAYILNTDPWKALTNESNNNVDMRSEVHLAEQTWYFTRKSDGSYKILNCKTGLALDGGGENSNLYTYTDCDNEWQSWDIFKSSDSYVLSSRASSTVIDIAGAGTEDGTNAQMFDANGTSAQQFSIYKIDDGSELGIIKDLGEDFTACIRNSNSELLLTVDENNNVVQRKDEKATEQIWSFTKREDGSYKILNCKTGLALDSGGENDNLYTYDSCDNTFQSWYVFGTKDAYRLTSQATNGFIDIAGGSTEDGVNAQIYESNGTTAQMFKIETVDYEIPATEEPTEKATEEPTEEPTETPTEKPTAAPTEEQIPDTRPTETTTTPVKPERMYCDTNDDGEIDIMDVIVLNKYLLGAGKLTNTGKKNSDTNGDGYLDTTDSLNILKRVVEILKDADFPVK